MRKTIILSYFLLFIFLSIILFPKFLSAKYSDIPVTRNLEPEKFKPCSFEEYRNKHKTKPTSFYEIRRIGFKNRDNLNFLVIVDSSLYLLIEDALSTYQNDMLNENTNSILVSFSSTSAVDMKDLIVNYYNSDNIVGVILIGNLPSAWYEMYEDFNNDGIPDGDLVEFPIDLYFSDLDGQWLDLDQNGIFDGHWGLVHPDIWIGRIKADNLSYSDSTEVQMINNYFERNHLYRTGSLQSSNIALAYIDDDWADWGYEYQIALQYVYSDVELINDINETTAEDYITSRLPADYEFIQVHVHSSPMAHYFYQDNGNNYQLVNNYELPIINPKAYFYNLFACSNAHFETENNMGGLYLLTDDFCLGTIGSTKTGSMLFFEDFYEPLSFENTLGEAFKLWWQQNVDTGLNNWWERSWFYGMVILGDPTLKIQSSYVIVDDWHYPESEQILCQNYPNPFSTLTTISFNLVTKSHKKAQIKIYNIKGQLVRTLTPITNDQCPMTKIVWDGKDENGKQLSNGIYFYKLTTKDKTFIKKLILMR